MGLAVYINGLILDFSVVHFNHFGLKKAIAWFVFTVIQSKRERLSVNGSCFVINNEIVHWRKVKMFCWKFKSAQVKLASDFKKQGHKLESAFKEKRKKEKKAIGL